jgi:hypothetical protein
LLKKVRVRKFEPETAARNGIARKKKVRDALLKVLDEESVDLDAVRDACKKAGYLSVDITFYLYAKSTATGRSIKDLDNMLKVVCDALPEHMVHDDIENQFRGVGLITGDSDDMIFEILSRKKLGRRRRREGI